MKPTSFHSFIKVPIRGICFLLLLNFLTAFLAHSQTLNKVIGTSSIDHIIDMASFDKKNYLLTDLSSLDSSKLIIGDSVNSITCGRPSLILLDDSMNLLNYSCFTDTSGAVKSNYFHTPAKIAYEPITHCIYVAGTFSGNIVFGSDTIYSENVFPSLYIARFDSNLNPIWAKTTLCSYPGFLELEITALEVDGQGRALLSFDMAQNSLVCFEYDTIYDQGTTVFDTSGLNTHLKIKHNTSRPSFNIMALVDQRRMLMVNSFYTQMVDVLADTGIWKKSYTVQQLRVDTTNKYFYTVFGGILTKRDLMGNILWSNSYTNNFIAKGMDLTKNKDKIYIAGITPEPYNEIFVLDSAGNVLDSMIWGIDTMYGHSKDINIKSFQIENDKLKISYNILQAKSVVFGMDTVQTLAHEDIILSFIDLNNKLTSVQQKEMNASSSFKIYPNPNTGTFMLEGDREIVQLDVYDLQGKYIQTVGSVPFKQISLSGSLPHGLYFLKIKTESRVEVVKMVLR